MTYPTDLQSGLRGTILRAIDAARGYPPLELTDLVSVVKRTHPEVPLVAVVRAVADLIAAGVVWPIGEIARVDHGEITQPFERVIEDC